VVIGELLPRYKVVHILIVPKEPSCVFLTLMRKGWLLVASMGILIFLDAAFDFCLLCALTYYVGRRQAHSAGETPDA
jgi:hypothetical protein